MFKKGKAYEIKDGREDAILFVDTERFLTIHQEGYLKMGMTYDQAQQLISFISELFIVASTTPGTGDGIK